MYTYQDFEKRNSDSEFLLNAIHEHKTGEYYKTAVDADLYDRQRNRTINEYVKVLYTLTGAPVEDFTASNSKIASNFFNRLNTQRNSYLLGNGITFKNGGDTTKGKLGADFDDKVSQLAYYALIHGIAFGYWNVDHLHVYPVTEFVPLWDEDTGALRAGIRWYQIDDLKPLNITLYEEDGYTKFRKPSTGEDLEMIQPKRSYNLTIAHTDFGGDEVIGEDNYGELPIIPIYGSNLKQSTLIGMQRTIDSFDLIRSGFANDLSDVSQIYWLIENAGGMDDEDLARFRDRLKLQHIAVVDTTDDVKIQPYTNEVPYQSRQAYLNDLRSQLYEDFGGLDVHTISAGSTNDHIDAAYQPVDEEADKYEFQITKFIKQLLHLIGIEDEPLYKRNRISNQTEQTNMVLSAGEYLDEETIIKHLPFITVDEVEEILERKTAEDYERFAGTRRNANNEENTDEEDEAAQNG